MEYIVLFLCIIVETDMGNEEALEEKAMHLLQLEEDRFITSFQQRVDKDRQKAWHDHHIKSKFKDIWCCYIIISS